MTTSRRPYRSTHSQGPRVDGTQLLCRECSVLKPVDAFRVLKSGSRESYCRECHNAMNRVWRARNSAAHNARRRASYQPVTHAPRACRGCGSEFAPHVATGIFCSRRCAARTAERERGVTQRGNCRYCLRPVYSKTNRQVYCSTECASKAHSVGASCAVPWRTCVACGQQFSSRRARATCTSACSRNSRAAAERAAYAPTPARVYTCDVCSESFTREGRHGSPRYCSAKCATQAPTYKAMRSRAARRRRAQIKGAAVERFDDRAVFARDKWRCQLCGGKVHPTRTYPHPESASLDHIVPLAKGGAHVPSNVQLAHFLCNSRKGDGRTRSAVRDTYAAPDGLFA